MSSNEEQKTGVYMLSPAQKQELEKWINEKFTLKASNPTSTPIYLQQNIQNGSQLQLTDGSLYEIAPSDQSKTAYWITPIPIKISSSSDPQYPVLLTNTLTGMSVQARLISTPSKTP
jgi:DNA replication protein DnaD